MFSIFSTLQKYLIVGLLILATVLSVTVWVQHSSNTELHEDKATQAQEIVQLKSDIALSNAQVEALKKASDDITEAATKLVEKARQDARTYVSKSDEILSRPQSGDACTSANNLLDSVITQ